uniref:Uncharacterized protein n=1 Tax=viral metagenome TaxID=1070528 RepID=A0A6C0I8K4_9ZZZZ
MQRIWRRANPDSLYVWADEYGTCLSVLTRITQDSEDLVGICSMYIGAAANPYIVECPFVGLVHEDGSSPEWDNIKRIVSEVEKATRKPGATELNDPLIVQFQEAGAKLAKASMELDKSPDGYLRKMRQKEEVAISVLKRADILIAQRDTPDRLMARFWAVQNLKAVTELRKIAEVHAAQPAVIEAVDELKKAHRDASDVLKSLRDKVRDLENKAPGGGFVNIPVKEALPAAINEQGISACAQPISRMGEPVVKNQVPELWKSVEQLHAEAVAEAKATLDELLQQGQYLRKNEEASEGRNLPPHSELVEARKAADVLSQKISAKQIHATEEKAKGGPGGGRRRGKKKYTKKIARKRRKAGTRRMR